MSEVTTDREAAAKQLAQDGGKVWRQLMPTEKDEWRRRAARRIVEDGGVRIHPTEDSTDAAAYVGVAMRGRMDHIAALEAIAMGPGHTVSEQTMLSLDVHPNDHDDVYEAAADHLNALPLAVEATTTFEIVLGTGGPDDRLLVECDRIDGEAGEPDIGDRWEIRRILYRYTWSGSGEVVLQGEDRAAAEAFARRVVPELVE